MGSYGCSKALSDRYLFDNGLRKLIAKVKPKVIIFYGTVTDSAKKILEEGHQKYVAFDPETTSVLEGYRNGNEG